MDNSSELGIDTNIYSNKVFVLEEILRKRIFNSVYWKQESYALNIKTLIEKAIDLNYIGGLSNDNSNVSPFICLLTKLLQINPDKNIILEMLYSDYKYISALAALFIRLNYSSKYVYEMLGPLLKNYKKLKQRNIDGSFNIIFNDEYIWLLLNNKEIFNITLPLISNKAEFIKIIVKYIKIEDIENHEILDSNNDSNNDVNYCLFSKNDILNIKPEIIDNLEHVMKLNGYNLSYESSDDSNN